MVFSITTEYYQLSLILILAAFAIPIARKISVVDVPILIIIGILFGPALGLIKYEYASSFMLDFGGFGFGILGIVFILYFESHHMDLKAIRKYFAKIVSLDTIGVIVTALLAGLIFSYVFKAPFSVGFLFGAIISPTDPATLIPLFKKIHVKEEISSTIIGESMFNDPISIVLVSIALFIVDPASSYSAFFSTFVSHIGLIPGSVLEFLVQIIIPALIGIVVGVLVIVINKIMNFENLVVAFMLGIVILEFIALQASKITPFPAVIATGAIIGNFSDKTIFWNRETAFSENLAVLSEAIIFIAIGGMLLRSDIVDYVLYGLLFTAMLLLVVRPAAVLASMAPFFGHRQKIDKASMAFYSAVGPRGIVSIVLSVLPLSIGLLTHNVYLLTYGPIITVITSFIVLFSIILNTLYVPFMSRMKLFRQRSIEEGNLLPGKES
ncbi:MAG: cation:proton antiporter [Thermoplasmatales archaeon]|nr:cation:proton antiporter [Thermoplasmatales archaeon]MCW6170954.1 cation:proton antiporter [Thermoplasmatales archaeon]